MYITMGDSLCNTRTKVAVAIQGCPPRLSGGTLQATSKAVHFRNFNTSLADRPRLMLTLSLHLPPLHCFFKVYLLGKYLITQAYLQQHSWMWGLGVNPNPKPVSSA